MATDARITQILSEVEYGNVSPIRRITQILMQVEEVAPPDRRITQILLMAEYRKPWSTDPTTTGRNHGPALQTI
jgi:hypothetical protein